MYKTTFQLCLAVTNNRWVEISEILDLKETYELLKFIEKRSCDHKLISVTPVG